jgi:PD-(D/E)XK endonuclease
MEHPKDVGDRSTLAVMLALCAAGYAVCLPFGENTRCDLVIDEGTHVRAGSMQDRSAPYIALSL